MPTRQTGSFLRWARVAPAIAGLAACAVFLGLTGANDKSGSLAQTDIGLMSLRPSDFHVEMERKGIIEPADSEIVRSQCYWRTPILSIVPEGTWVQEGDVVCVLDSAEIEEYARTREVRLIKYRGLLDNALHDERMQETASERSLSAAEFAFQSAEENLKTYQQANFPEDVLQLERDIALQDQKLTSIRDDARHAEKLWAMGMMSTSQMSRTSLKLMNSEQRRNELQNRLDFLTEFTNPRTSLKLEYSRTNASRNVTQIQLRNSLAATRARLTSLAWERRVRIYEKYHKRALDSIEACTLRAPRSGQVIYGNSWYERSRGITRIEEGKTVRMEQRIFEIPDSRRLKVSVPVDEALVYDIQPGAEVVVEPTGYPGLEVQGVIQSVARYPRARSRYTPGVKDYWVEVDLDPTEEQLKFLSPRQDVSVRFVLNERPNELVIPRDCVTGVAGHNFVFVMERDELVPRRVELGAANESDVCIQSGLNEGDQVVTSMTDQHHQRLHEILADDLGVVAVQSN